MYKDNKVEYIQLFDARYLDKYETRTYTFTSKSYKDVFKSLNVSYRSLTEPYGNREMLTSIELNKYDNDVPFNFDLIYVLCDQKGENCGINEGDSNILMATFKKEEVFNLVESFKDISDYNLEFGKNYYLGVYARASYYASNDSSSLTTQDIELNKYNGIIFDRYYENDLVFIADIMAKNIGDLLKILQGYFEELLVWNCYIDFDQFIDKIITPSSFLSLKKAESNTDDSQFYLSYNHIDDIVDGEMDIKEKSNEDDKE